MGIDFFPYKCEVLRSLGEFDEYDQPITKPIFRGRCDLQWGSSKTILTGGIEYQSKPTLFIDCQDILFKLNDIVKVQLANNRNVTCTIENFDTIIDGDIGGTQIWLKGMVDE